MLKEWDELPDFMRTDEVRPYYDGLKKKELSLALKRAMDMIGGILLLIVLAIPMAFIALWIKLDSEGPVFYRQERVTTYGKHFRIHKFRTMVSNADKTGSAVTVGNDSRITKVGAKLRGCRLDELPQILDLISGDMSFVGTRPEAVKYVEKYKPEYLANEPLGFNDYNKLQMNALAIVSDSGTLPEESSFYLSIGHPIAAVCIRTSTERPEALEAGNFILAGITTNELLNATDMAIDMKQKGILGKPCPDYVDETVSMKVVRIIQGYVNVVNKFVWRKDAK